MCLALPDHAHPLPKSERIKMNGSQISALKLLAITLLASAASVGSAAVPIADCPLAGQPFSLDSSLYEIFSHPSAKAAVDRAAPGFLGSLPNVITGTRLPALSAIISLRMVSGRTAVPASLMGDALKGIPVTAEDERLRCAQYDGGKPPELPAVTHHPAVLVFEKSTGFRDTPSVDAATAALRLAAQRDGWQVVFTDRPAVFNQRDLARFDAVVWNNVSGDVLSLSQRAAFKAYIERGGGYAGIHGSNGDPLTWWDWYNDTLIGARFKGHPAAPQFQQATVLVDDPHNPVTAGLGTGWAMTEEWYSFKTNPRATGAHILATLDESSYKPVSMEGDLHMGDHPIAWTRCVGKGRSFYTAIGHLPQSYTQSSAALLLSRGIEWAATAGKAECVAAAKPG
jgi:type 1 glutamine amidotransferase